MTTEVYIYRSTPIFEFKLGQMHFYQIDTLGYYFETLAEAQAAVDGLNEEI